MFNFLDPKGKKNRTSGKDRRKFDDPKYNGPERRNKMKRKKSIDRILELLEKQLQ